MSSDVLERKRPDENAWYALFQLFRTVDAPADFMATRPLNMLSQMAGIFD
jgi:antitoxin VapB